MKAAPVLGLAVLGTGAWGGANRGAGTARGKSPATERVRLPGVTQDQGSGPYGKRGARRKPIWAGVRTPRTTGDSTMHLPKIEVNKKSPQGLPGGSIERWGYRASSAGNPEGRRFRLPGKGFLSGAELRAFITPQVKTLAGFLPGMVSVHVSCRH